MNIKSFSKIAFFLLLTSLILVSCRTDPSNTTTTETTKFKNAGSKTVYVAMPVKLRTVNPLSKRSPYSTIVYSPVIQPLMEYGLEEDSVVPILVKGSPEEKEITEGKYAGGVSYTFEIREEAVWDDGSPVTGKDVEFTLKAIFAPKVNVPVYVHYYPSFKEVVIDAENPKKFTFLLDEKYMLGEAAASSLPIIPEYIYDAKKVLRQFSLADLIDKEKSAEIEKNNPEILTFAEEFNSPKFQRETMVGSGAYKFEEWVTGQRVVLSRKKDWWGNKFKKENSFMAANADSIFFRIIPDGTARATAIKNEDVDVAFMINVQDFQEIEESERMQELYSFFTPQTFASYFIYLNTKSPFLEDKRVRRALAHLTDTDLIIDNIYNGKGTKTSGIVSPLHQDYNDKLKPIEYDLEKAVSLLTEAGWTDSDENGILDKEINGKKEEMVLRMPSSDTKFSKDLGAFLKESFSEVGIKLETETLEFNKLREKQNKREYDLSSAAMGGNPTPFDFHQIYHTDADSPRGANRTGFGNAKSDEIIEKLQVTLSREERKPLYDEFHEILYDEQPKIFLFSPKERIVISKRLEGKGYGYRPFVYAPSLKFK